jgi:CrcB protein
VTALLVIAGGSAGAIARWATDRAVQSRHRGDLPWGTFLVNIVGSFVLGFVLAATTSVAWLALLATGFCGAFTTFSTFAYEAVRLAETGRTRSAATYVLGSVAVGLGLVALGWWLGGTVGG